MKDLRVYKPRGREVNMLPLINVIFLLVIFFLAAGTIEKFQVVQVEPPYADSGKPVDEGHIIVILGYHEELLIDDELIDASEFGEIMKKKIKKNPNAIVTVKADARLRANALIHLMEEIKKAGGKNLSLMTQSFT